MTTMPKPKRRTGPGAGRPTKLNDTVQSIIVQKLEDGLSIHHACLLANISPGTYSEWLERGSVDTEGIFFEFAQAVERAKAVAAARHMEIIEAQIQGGLTERSVQVTLDSDDNKISSIVTTRRTQPDARLALTMLERRHPEFYGKTQEDVSVAMAGVTLNLVFDDGDTSVVPAEARVVSAEIAQPAKKERRPSPTTPQAHKPG